MFILNLSESPTSLQFFSVLMKLISCFSIFRNQDSVFKIPFSSNISKNPKKRRLGVQAKKNVQFGVFNKGEKGDVILVFLCLKMCLLIKC